MKNFAILLSYEGTAYAGFQAQPRGRPTIQGCLEHALLQLTGEQVTVFGSGRTDAGVHAMGQVVSFVTSAPISARKWPISLNSVLPNDIRVQAAQEVGMAFHARKSAHRKMYRYTIYNHHIPDVFRHRMEYRHPVKLQVESMREAIKFLLGTHDFSSFCSRLSTKKSHVRTIYRISLEEEEGRIADTATRRLHLYICGDGFLHHMVRIIVGTLLQIGEGKLEPGAMAGILAAKDRVCAGPTAKAQGLILWEVDYGEKLFS